MCLAKNTHLLSRLGGNIEPHGGEPGPGCDVPMQALFSWHGHSCAPMLESPGEIGQWE